jgi:cytochrome c oxidase subunit III
MASLVPTITVKDPQIGRGGGDTHPPVRDGGGESGGSGGSPDYEGRLRRARLGLAVLVVPITMLFVAFTSAYIVRQGLPTFDEHTGKYVTDWLQVNLPVGALLLNTLLLLMSSVTVELARRQLMREVALAQVETIPGVSLGRQKKFPWLSATLVLGIGFLMGQWLVWQELGARGFYVATSPSSSFFYLLTAAHGIHLAGGILVMLYAGIIAALRKPVETRCIVVDITAWYWHFMAALWVYIFALLYFAR